MVRTRTPLDPNPFVYSRPLPADEVVDRRDETERLVAHVHGGHFVRLVAPRRYGKTSLLGKLLAQLERDHGYPGALVDLYGVTSVADLSVRIERAYAEGLRGRIRRDVDAHLRTVKLGLSLGVVGLSAEIGRSGRPHNTLPALHALLDVPTVLHRRGGRRLVVAFDEFQDLLAIPGADAVLRSHIQHQGAYAGYVFAGSAPGMMNALFGNRSRPLYGQAVPEELGPLDSAELADYVTERFARSGRDADEVVSALLETAQGHPQRAMLLAHHLFAQTPAGRRADAATWQAALGATMAELDGEFREYWRGRTVGEQRVLRAIVAFGSPYAGAASRLGLKSSSAAGAVERLRGGGDLWPDGFRLTDPLLAGWIERFDRAAGGTALPGEEADGRAAGTSADDPQDVDGPPA